MNPSDKYEQIKDIKRLNPVELEAMVLKHEQQIKDIAAHLLELKRLVTPMMEFKREKLLQEPVAWLVTYGGLTQVSYTQPTQVVDTHYQPLYAAPPQRKWVGLTDDEVWKILWETQSAELDAHGDQGSRKQSLCTLAIQAKLKEKNGG